MSLHYGPKDGNPLLVNNIPTVLLRLEGNWTGEDGKFLQVHDAATTAGISTTTIVKSYYLQANSLYSYSFINAGISLLNGCVIAVSSNADPAAYTAYAGAGVNTVECEIEPWQLVNPASLTAAGDLVTGVDTLSVWTNASSSNRLFQVDVINGLGAVGFVCFFATASVANGKVPMFVMPLANVATVQTFRFGDDGGVMLQKVNVAVNGITGDTGGQESGSCTIAISTADANGNFTGVLTEDGGAKNNIRAFYSVIPIQPIAVLQPTAL